MPANEIYYRGYNPGTSAEKIAGIYNSYGAEMEYGVGFAGHLIIDESLVNQLGDPANQYASVKIGLGTNTSLSGTYDGYSLPISNDDNQIWEYKLYVNTTGGNYLSSNWTALDPGIQSTLFLDFGGDVNFDTLTDIGYLIQFNKLTTGLNINTSDDYHTSVVPVPGALLLSLIGLGTLRMRFSR